jgi:hypothetical protein
MIYGVNGLGIIVLLLDVSCDWTYGSCMGILVRASSKSDSVRMLVLQLGVSDIHRKPLGLQYKTLHFDSICRTSFGKRIGSVEALSTIFPGIVHTALKRQAPLRLLIQRVQTNSVSKPKLVIGMSKSSNGAGRSIQPPAISCNCREQSPVVQVVVKTQQMHSNSRIQNKMRSNFMP